MLRQGGLIGGKSLVQRPSLCVAETARAGSSRTKASKQYGEGEKSANRRWLEAFDKNSDLVPSSISRSRAQRSTSNESGYCKSPQPKAILDTPINALAKYITTDMVDRVKNSPLYIQDSDTISITSDQGMKQKHKLQHCFQKLKQLLRDAAKEAVAKDFDPDKLHTHSPKILAKTYSMEEKRNLSSNQFRALKNKRETEYRKLKKNQAKAERIRLITEN